MTRDDWWWDGATAEEAWWGLHIARGSGQVVRREDTWRYAGVEHGRHRHVASRVAHQPWGRDHGSRARMHLLARLHERLRRLLLHGVIQAGRPLQDLCRMHRPNVAFRVAELLLDKAGRPWWAHLALLNRATLLHEVWLTFMELWDRSLSLWLRHAHDLLDPRGLRRMSATLHELHQEVSAGLGIVLNPATTLTLCCMALAEKVL